MWPFTPWVGDSQPEYYHRAPGNSGTTYCGMSVAGAVPDGPPPWGTAACPICEANQ